MAKKLSKEELEKQLKELENQEKETELEKVKPIDKAFINESFKVIYTRQTILLTVSIINVVLVIGWLILIMLL